MDTPTESAVATPTVSKLEYTGDGTEMALLFLKNLFLSIITLGVYRAWARTNLRRYVWGHTVFWGDRASYVGTGVELFKGWMKLIGLIVGILIVLSILGAILPPLKFIVPFLTPFAYILLFAVATYSGLRYRLSRTKWREIRFGVDKDKASTHEYLILYIKGVFLTAITLGIYWPWFSNSLKVFLTNRCRLGNVYFAYAADPTAYAKLFFRGLFLSIITIGFYIPWMIRSLTEFRLNHTTFQNSRFLFTLKGSDLLIFAICAYFGAILTLGLATPWLYNWGLRLFIGNVSVEGDIDMTRVIAQASEGSAMAEEAVLDYDLDLGF